MFVHWPLMGGVLHLVQQGGDWAGPQPAQAPPCCTKCNTPPINGRCTNRRIAVLWSVALRFYCGHKGLTDIINNVRAIKVIRCIFRLYSPAEISVSNQRNVYPVCSKH